MFTYNIYYHALILFILQFASWVKLTFNNEDEWLFTPKIKSLLMGSIPGFFLGGISGYIIFDNGLWLGIASGIISGSLSSLIALLFFNLRMWIRRRKENKKNNKRSKKQKIYK